MRTFTYEAEGRPIEFPVRGREVRIGRDPSLEIVTTDRSVSKRHVSCTVEAGRVVARDQGSANGMFLNGLRVTEAELRDGDVLRAGSFELRFADRPQADDGTMIDGSFGLANSGPFGGSFPEAQAAACAVLPPVASPAPAWVPPAPPPAPPMPPVALVAPTGTALGALSIVQGMPPRTVELRAGGRLELGSLETNAVVLSGEGVSRRHAEVVPRGKGWIVRDLGSRNGTYVNGRKVTERELADGDRIAIGSVQLAYAVQGSGAARPAGCPRLPRRAVPAAAAVVALLALVCAWRWWPVKPSVQAPAPPVADAGEDREHRASIKLQAALDQFAASLRARFLDPSQTGATAQALSEAIAVMPANHPDRRLVSGLATILAECQNRQPGYADMNWRQLETSAVELRNYATGARLSGALLEWARAEHTDRGNMGDALDYLRAGKHEEAYSAFKRIRPESVYARAAADRMISLKDVLTDRTVRAVQPQMAAGEYAGALDAINRVLNLLEGRFADVVVILGPVKKECERWLRSQTVLRDAETRFSQGRLDEAGENLDALAGAPQGIAKQAERLRGEIAARRTWLQAKERMDAGDAEAAIGLLRSQNHPDLVQLRTLAQRVFDLVKTAQKADADHRPDDAAVAWSQVHVLLEDQPESAYLKEAQKRKKTPDALAQAGRACAQGVAALRDGEYAEARDRFEEALRLYTGHPESRKAIDSFVREKDMDYNRDLAAFRDGRLRLDELIPRWERVLSFLRPGDPILDKYVRDLARLKQVK